MARRQIVLAVDDEEEMLRLYERFFATLGGADFRCAVAPDGERALGILAHEPVDLLLLDWGLPGISGLSLVKALRANPKTRDLGILMVTGKGTPNEIVNALDAGADDHITKPFEDNVLLARLKSLARRREATMDQTACRRLPGLELDSDAIRLDGHPLALPLKELHLLRIFLHRPNVHHTHSYLWNEVWGYESDNWRHILITTISSLRGKLGPVWGKKLQSHRSQGYSFQV